MRVTLFAIIALHASTAMGMNLFQSDKDDHRSLDVCIDRLEVGTKKDIKAVIHHLRLMRGRRGGEISGRGKVVPGSQEEIDLLCRLANRQGTPFNLGEATQDAAVGFFRWTYGTVIKLFNVVLPGFGTALPFLIFLIILYINRGRVLGAMYSCAKKLPKETRKQTFNDPLIDKDYQSKKKKGKV